MRIGQLPNKQLSDYAVRLTAHLDDNRLRHGTGFWYGFAESDRGIVPTVVTNRHVLTCARAVSFRMRLVHDGSDADPLWSDRTIQLSADNVFMHPNSAIDLAAIEVGSDVRELQSSGNEPYLPLLGPQTVASRNELVEVGAAADVLMVGYPTGLWDARNNQPIIRRGIAATHPAVDFEGRPEFLLDIACFPGSSGSPVFLYESGTFVTPHGDRAGGTINFGSRTHLLGVVWGYHRYDGLGRAIATAIPDEASGDTQVSALHLAYAIHATELEAINDVVRASITPS